MSLHQTLPKASLPAVFGRSVLAHAADLGLCPRCAGVGQPFPVGHLGACATIVQPSTGPGQRSPHPEVSTPSGTGGSVALSRLSTRRWGCRGPRRPFRQLSRVGQAHARARAARPTRDGFICPRLADVAIPSGYQAVTDPAAALAAVDELPALAGMRADSYVTRRAVWAALVDHLHPGGVVVAGQARIAERASVHAGKRIARATAGNHLRALVAAGALLVALHGSSRTANGGVRDIAPAYVLLAPVDESVLTAGEQAAVDALTARLAAVDEVGHLPEGDTAQPPVRETHARRTGFLSTQTRISDPEHYAPLSAADRRRAVWWIAAVMGWHDRPGLEVELSIVCGLFFSAGWSPRAVVTAWRRRPDGQPWPGPLPEPHQRDRADPVRARNLWAVLTYRLAGWRDPAGWPVEPPVPVQRPRRGRPPVGDRRRRELADRVASLGLLDPRRRELMAELRGEHVEPGERIRERYARGAALARAALAASRGRASRAGT